MSDKLEIGNAYAKFVQHVFGLTASFVTKIMSKYMFPSQ